MQKHTVEKQIGGETIKIETGILGKQAAGCVLVTHDMPQARAYANRAYVMLEGRVVEELPLPDGQPTHPYARMLFDPWGEHDLAQSTAN